MKVGWISLPLYLQIIEDLHYRDTWEAEKDGEKGLLFMQIAEGVNLGLITFCIVRI